MVCKKCGVAPESVTAKFCSACGTRLTSSHDETMQKINLDAHVKEVMDQALTTAWRGNARSKGARRSRRATYLWYGGAFLLLLFVYLYLGAGR